jgi:hypothetical protein
MSKKVNDPRFDQVFNDPIFKPVPKKISKIKLDDERFKEMFKGNRFNEDLDIDEYGRKNSNKN